MYYNKIKSISIFSNLIQKNEKNEKTYKMKKRYKKDTKTYKIKKNEKKHTK